METMLALMFIGFIISVIMICTILILIKERLDYLIFEIQILRNEVNKK